MIRGVARPADDIPGGVPADLYGHEELDRETLPPKDPPPNLRPFAVANALARGVSAEEAEEFGDRVVRNWDYRYRHGGRRCTKCQRLKPTTAYGPDPRTADNCRRDCRECVAAAARAYREARKAAEVPA